MSIDQEYLIQISRFKRNGKCSDYERLLNHQPSNLLQLNFWCQLMFLAKIDHDDVPDNGVFYLHDQTYYEVTNQLEEVQKNKIIFKIELLTHVLGMSANVNIGISRQLEECLMIAAFGKSTPNVAVKSYLKFRTNFLSLHALEQLSEWIVKYTILNRTLASLDPITLINIIMNRLSNFPFEDEALQNFIVSQSKKALCVSLKEYIMKSKDHRMLEFLLSVSGKLNIQEEFFRGSICNQHESEILYHAYFEAKRSNNLHKCKNLQNYMLKNSAIQGLTLHSILYYQPTINQQELGELSLKSLVEQKNKKIFPKIYQSPFTNTCSCLEIYLEMSQFKIPKQENQRVIYTRQTFQLSPLSFMAIHKKFWFDPFHRDVLNLILWVLTDHWILQAEVMISSRVDLEDYKRNIYLGLMIFMIGFPLGSFVSYYPSEKNFLADLFNLPNFSSLILSNSRFLEIPWFIFVINSELKTVIRQENGYELAYQILTNKGTSFEQHFGTYLLNTIEMQVQRPKQANWYKNKKYILKILEEYCQGTIYIEKANSLKIAVQTKL